MWRTGSSWPTSSARNVTAPTESSASKEVPNLASQRPVYVYIELKAYQRGDRAGGETHRVNFLNDEALANLAAYYASLDPAPPPGAPAPARVNAVAAGKAASEPCSKCHGERGVSHKAGVPSLIGLHPKYLVESMKAYKEGDRSTDARSEEMKKALTALSDEDLDHIARYYAAQSDNLKRAQTPNEGGAPLAGKRDRRLRQVPWGRRRQHKRGDPEPCGSGCNVPARRAPRVQGREAAPTTPCPRRRKS